MAPGNRSRCWAVLVLAVSCSTATSSVIQMQLPGDATRPSQAVLPSPNEFPLSLERANEDYKRADFSTYRQVPDLKTWISKLVTSNNNMRPPGRFMDRHVEVSGSALGKRQSFSSWAGKRNAPLPGHDQFVFNLRSLLQDRLFHRELGNKRQQFSAWAGKRSTDEKNGRHLQSLGHSTTRLEEAAGPSSAKRADESVENLPLRDLLEEINDNEGQKRAFSAWSGKRSTDEKNGRHLQSSGHSTTRLEEVAEPSSAKRADESVENGQVALRDLLEEIDNNEGQKRAFSAWSGKRGGYDDA